MSLESGQNQSHPLSMQIITRLLSSLLLASLLLVSCKSESTSETSALLSSEPSNEAAVLLLQNFASRLEAGDFSKAALLMNTPPGISEDEKLKAMKGIIEKGEISSAGVAILAEEGTWRTLTEVFADRGSAWAERWELAPEKCWALGLEPAETAFVWTGDSFLLFRCDDVGKLGNLSE